MAEAAADAGGVAEVQANGASAPAVGSTELPSLRSEGERLKLERDNAQLRAELAALNKPWWRKGAIVTTLTAIIAAVLPVTTAVQAHYQKEREIALQESKQAHEIRTSYLDRMDKPGAKLRTLRFVLATTTDPALKAWAEEEEKRIQAELDEIDRQISYLQSQESSAEPNRSDQEFDTASSKVASTSQVTPSKSKITTTETEQSNTETIWHRRELARLRSKRDEARAGSASCPGTLTKDQELQCLHDLEGLTDERE